MDREPGGGKGMAETAGVYRAGGRLERGVIIVLVLLVIIGAAGHLLGWSKVANNGATPGGVAGNTIVETATVEGTKDVPEMAPATPNSSETEAPESAAMVDQPSIVRVESSEALETATIAETGLAGDEDKTTALPEQSGSTVVDGTKTEEITAGAKVEPETDTAGSDVSDAAQEVVATLEAPEVFDSERVIQPDAKPLSDELVSPQATTEGASATDSVSPEVPESPSAALQTPETGPTAAAPTALTPETAPPDAPLFDLVRVDAAGAAILAGRARPGAEVTILLDGAPKATALAGPDGKFAALFMVAPSIAPQQVALMAEGADGPLRGAETLIIAPSPQSVTQPADVASEPETSPAAGAALPTATTGAPAARQPAVAPRLLLADDTGLRVVQAAPAGQPSAQTSVSIDAISYDAGGAVVLSGRGTGAIRIYLDNQAVQTVPVAEDGQWRTPLPAVDTGVYTLRVDALDADGSVTSRVQTPFQREEPGRIAALAADQEAVARGPHVITVQPGSTLWGIAREEYGQGILFVRVFEANRDTIVDPHWIYPGQVFAMPEADDSEP